MPWLQRWRSHAHYAWPALVLVVGLGLSALLGMLLWQRAADTWEKRAEQAAAQQSILLLGWIEESYAMLSGLGAWMENAADVDGGQFLSAVEGLESRAKSNFMPAKALLENASEGWTVRFSSAPSQADASFPQPDSAPTQTLQDALTAAQDTPNEWVMSAPFADAQGKHFVYVVMVSAAKPDFAVVGVMLLQRMLSNLTEANDRSGMHLELKLKAEGAEQPARLTAKPPTATVVFDSNTLAYTARANLDLHWKFTHEFEGGPDRRLAGIAAGSGSVLSLVMAIFVAALMRQNRQVQRRVEVATRDIARTMEVKSEVAALALSVQQASTAAECAALLLRRLADRLGCQQGLVALARGPDTLEVIARYGAPPATDAPARYAIGDSVLGECVRKGQPVTLKLPQTQAWRIRSGLGSSTPAEVWMAPMQHGQQLVGVIELAALQPLDDGTQALLHEVMQVMALRLSDLAHRASGSA